MDEYVLLWAQSGLLNLERYQYLIRLFGDLKAAWLEIDANLLTELGFKPDKIQRTLAIRDRTDLDGLFRLMDDHEVRLLCFDDSIYPEPLKEIPNPPPFLFVRGTIPPLHKAIGIVGTRRLTTYGQTATLRITGDLVQNGFTIVSGLAMGADACAHQVCLDRKGTTVAVLGCGVDRPYPIENRRLAARILASGGALISEYALGTPALPHHFPERNRIISGLSKGILVVEGGVKSGALITARYALEQGREVFAVPSPIHVLEPSGTNHLIRKGEAKLVERVEDILDEFGFQKTLFDAAPRFAPDEAELLKKIVDGKSIDQLADETRLNVARLSEILIRLQLKGAAREIGGKWMIL
jgi:DNA processing protein